MNQDWVAREYETFAASTHGRVVFHKDTFQFDPYLTRSQAKQKKIQNEKGLKKLWDSTFFQLNRLSGFQTVADQLSLDHDDNAAHKLYWTYPMNKLRVDMGKHHLSFIGAMFNGAQIAASVMALLGGTYASGEYVYNSLRRGHHLENEFLNFGWRSELLGTEQGKAFVNSRLRVSSAQMERSIVNRECYLCTETIQEKYNGPLLPNGRKAYYLHCREASGGFKQDAEPLCRECFELEHQRQKTNAGAPRFHFSEVQCPLCTKPMISDEQLSEFFNVEKPKPRTFSEYVRAKCITEPVVNTTNTLSKLLPRSLSRGYQRLARGEESAESEMINLLRRRDD